MRALRMWHSCWFSRRRPGPAGLGRRTGFGHYPRVWLGMLSSPLPVAGPDPPVTDGFVTDVAQSRQRVLLICPPFQALNVASLAIARLATGLRAHGIHCGEAYLHFEFARLVGTETYKSVADATSGLVGELIFAEGLHGTPRDPRAAQQLTQLYGPAAVRAKILTALAERCLLHVQRDQPDIVGITTSFNQLLAALWLTRIIKREHLRVRVVLGGASCLEPMGPRVLGGYPEVDFVVAGCGDWPLLQLGRGSTPRGRYIRGQQQPLLDELPVPEYDQFLQQAAEFTQQVGFALSFESSRGCWWGQKNQCRFCGVNGPEMRFMSKSTERVVHEIRALWDSYHHNLSATDEIMSREHLRDAMAQLAKFKEQPELFYEVKTNMQQADIAALHRANVRNLQPGIESLSTHLLSLLNKGVSAIRNLALLKWCREYHIYVHWNLLCAIPGEKSEDYDQQILLIDKIPHFQPPLKVNPIRIDRFSPYFTQYQAFGWEQLEPFEEYYWLHPHLEATAISDIAYHFNGKGGVQPNSYLKRLRASLQHWSERYFQNDGLFFDPEQGLIRNESKQGMNYGKNPVLFKIIELTHDIAPIAQVVDLARCHSATIEQLAKANILYIEGGKVLNLAIRHKLLDSAGGSGL
jgi:ribosomal peptide maturation radical SAM protein 1